MTNVSDPATVHELQIAAEKWLDNYGPIEHYDNGYRGCVQLNHGDDEYQQRMDLIDALTTWLGEGEIED